MMFSMRCTFALTAFILSLLISILMTIMHPGTSSSDVILMDKSRISFGIDIPLNMTNVTKLILFLHLRKAGGTSIVGAAKQKLNLYRPNRNGNPHDLLHDVAIPFWTYSKQKLIEFFIFCRDHHITFVAVEGRWFTTPSIFDSRFKHQYGMELVTQIRNPFNRFISDYLYVQRYMQRPYALDTSFVSRLKRYHQSASYHHETHSNMYIRVLTSQFDTEYNVTRKDLEIAKGELDKFDLVTVLEMEDVAQVWKAKYEMFTPHLNANDKYDEIYAVERELDNEFDRKLAGFQREFAIWHKYDYMLYDFPNINASMRVEYHKEDKTPFELFNLRVTQHNIYQFNLKFRISFINGSQPFIELYNAFGLCKMWNGQPNQLQFQLKNGKEESSRINEPKIQSHPIQINTISSREDFETSLAKWGKSGTHLILQADGFEMRIDATHAKHDVSYSKTHEGEHETTYDVSRIHIQSIKSDGTRTAPYYTPSPAYIGFSHAFEDEFKKLESTQPSYVDDKVKTLLEVQKNSGLGDESYNVAAELTVKYDRTKDKAEFVVPVHQGKNEIFQLEFHILFNESRHQTVYPRPIIWVYDTDRDMFQWNDTLHNQLQFQWAVEEAKESPRIKNGAEWKTFWQSLIQQPSDNPPADLSFKAYMADSHQDGYQLDIIGVRKQDAKGAAESAEIYTFDVSSFKFSEIGPSKMHINHFIAEQKKEELNNMSDNTTQVTIEYPIHKEPGVVESKLVFGPKERNANNLQEWTVTITMTFYKGNVGIEMEEMKWHEPYPEVELEKSTGSQS